MIDNDEKGSYGAYSSAGKNSAEIFLNIRRKDIILNPKNKKNKQSIIQFLKRNGYHNIHGEDQQFKHDINEELEESQLEEVEEDIDIFKKEVSNNLSKKPSSEKKKKKRAIDKNEPNYFHKIDKAYYKFHDLHRQKGTNIHPDTTPNCTKYLPSKKLVWRKTINWPSWDKMKARQPFCGRKAGKIYINHGDILSEAGPCFIAMDKQTMRGERIPESHNLRIITTRPFSPNPSNSISYFKNGKINKKISHNFDNKYSIRNNSNEIFLKNNQIYTYKNMKNLRYNNELTNDYINTNWLKNRGLSANTSSTRPQTGKPLNINIFHSRPTTSSPNITINNNKHNLTENFNGNINKSHITSKSDSNEEKEKNDKIENINNDNNKKDKYDINIDNKTNINANENEQENPLSEETSEFNDSYHKFKNIYQKQIKKKIKDLTQSVNSKDDIFQKKSINENMKIKKKLRAKPKKSTNSLSKRKKNFTMRPKSNKIGIRFMIHKKKINGPDFKKIISREYYMNLSNKGSSLIPFSLPNFKQVRERSLTMVIYERPHYNKKETNYMKGIEPSMYNDQYKYLEFINNHTRCVPPNLDKMMARPKDDGSPLPVYMKGCISREACNITTDMSLKMNNYAEGKFLSNYTSFWPKKSFNKIINLNLLNSDTFISNFVKDKNKIKNSGNYITRSIRFYNKNFNDLIREGMLNKFDNITLKTIKPNHKIGPKELDYFLKNFENEKANVFNNKEEIN